MKREFGSCDKKELFTILIASISRFGQQKVNKMQKISLCLSGFLLSYFYSTRFDNDLK